MLPSAPQPLVPEFWKISRRATRKSTVVIGRLHSLTPNALPVRIDSEWLRTLRHI